MLGGRCASNVVPALEFEVAVSWQRQVASRYLGFVPMQNIHLLIIREETVCVQMQPTCTISVCTSSDRSVWVLLYGVINHSTI